MTSNFVVDCCQRRKTYFVSMSKILYVKLEFIAVQEGLYFDCLETHIALPCNEAQKDIASI